jgi:hypothetical protein
MQYGQRKLQRSVTEIRKSRNGRPNKSVIIGYRFVEWLVGQGLEQPQHLAGCVSPVADAILGVQRQLGDGLAVRRQVKDRIIPETVVTRWFVLYHPGD